MTHRRNTNRHGSGPSGSGDDAPEETCSTCGEACACATGPTGAQGSTGATGPASPSGEDRLLQSFSGLVSVTGVPLASGASKVFFLANAGITGHTPSDVQTIPSQYPLNGPVVAESLAAFLLTLDKTSINPALEVDVQIVKSPGTVVLNAEFLAPVPPLAQMIATGVQTLAPPDLYFARVLLTNAGVPLITLDLVMSVTANLLLRRL